LWKKTGLDTRVPIVAANLDPRSEEVRRDREKFFKLLKTIPRDLFVRIYLNYQPDFELFNYNFDQILTAAGHQPLTTKEREIKPLS
jgi:hypothetical protein